MVKKVEAWLTENGELFLSEQNAKEYEIRKKIRHNLQYWAPKYFTDTSKMDNAVWDAITHGWRELRDIFNNASNDVE